MAGRPLVEPVANLGIGRIDFITQAVVQGEAPGDTPLVLRVSGRDIIPQPAIELPAALEEFDGLARQEAGERIAEGKWREDEEPVGRDAVNQIHLGASELGAGLEAVFARDVREGVVRFVRVLVRVARSGDGVADAGVSADNQIRWPGSDAERGLIREAERAGQVVVEALIELEIITEKSDPRRLDGARREEMRTRDHGRVCERIVLRRKAGHVGAVNR